jgi:DNA polymerase III subunit delta
MASRRLSPQNLRVQISSGELDPVYLLYGDDEVEKTSLAGAFSAAIEEDVRAFNVERVYGAETQTTIAGVLDSARTLPWLASRRIILVLQAERLLAPKRESEATSRDLEELEAYIRSPQPHAALVLIAGELDRRRRVVGLLMRHATVVECDGLEGAGDAARWIRGRVAEAGGRMDAGAVRLLAERSGHDIGRLRADLERVLTFVGGERPVTAADVEEVAGDPGLKDQWAIARAIEAGSAGVALRELALLLDGGAAPLQILGQLGWIVRTEPPKGRFPAEGVAAAVEALFRTDLALKTSAGDPRVLLERLIVDLCGAVRPAGGRRSTTPGRPA